MGSFSIIGTIFLLSFSFSLSVGHPDYQTFLECVSKSSYYNTEILERIHTPTSQTYINFIGNASQNARFRTTSGRPFLIVAPKEEAELQPIILCSQEFGHQIRVRSGGHDYEGMSYKSENPFIMIELTYLNKIEIDIKNETAWIQTGVKLGELYYAIANKSNTHGFPAGLYPTVGSGGHISGGGIGTLMRKYGLASDNVIDARIMGVDGKIRDRKSMGDDIFWAIRGSGQTSFGVVLAWKLRLVRVPENVTTFSIRRRLEPKNFDLLQKWQNTAYNLTEDLFIRLVVQTVPKNVTSTENLVIIKYNGLFLGPVNELVPLLKKTYPEFELETEDCFKTPVIKNCSEQPCLIKDCAQVSWIKSVLYFSAKAFDTPLESLLEKKVNNRTSGKFTSDFLQAPIPNEGWKMINEKMVHEDHAMLLIDPLGGKMDEIGEDETAFPHRKGNLFNLQYLSFWNATAEGKPHIEWVRDLHKAMEPYVSHNPRSAYMNYKDLFLGKNDKNCSYEHGKVWGEKYFKGNFDRLARIKGKVDPKNFFRNELSIPVLL